MRAGDVISGRYRLEQLLGQGGLGYVWAAMDLSLDREVALKLLKPTADAEDRRRFELEARALSRLHHRHCVVIHDTGFTAEGEAFLVMERLRGASLASLRGTHLSMAEIRTYALQIAAALEYAHSRGITHRDLKPENIFLADEPGGPSVKVLDFGLAKLTYPYQPDITKTGEVIGTPHYMSPEQLRGARDVGPASDVYSLGVVLFELIEGHRPFEGASLFDIGIAHISTPPPPIRRAECPRELAALVEGMLAKAASDRPSVAAVRAGFAGEAPRQIAPAPAQTAVAPPPGRSAGFGSGRGIPVAVGIATALGLLAALIAWPEDDAVATRAAAPVRPSPGGLMRTAVPAAQQPAQSPEPAPCLQPHPPGELLRGQTITGLSKIGVIARIPAGFGDGRPRPLVLLLHHEGSSFQTFAAQTGLAAPADEHGFVLAGLEHRSPGHDLDIRENAEAALNWLADNVCIDREQVVIVAHGIGSVAGMRLSCEPWLTALVTASYLPARGAPYDCQPARPLPALHLAPLEAPHVPAEGGVRCNGLAATVAPAASIDEFETIWRGRNGSQDEPRATPYRDGECQTWSGEARLTFCRIAGGYGWPGTGTLEPWCDTLPSKFPANEVVWEFLTPFVGGEAAP